MDTKHFDLGTARRSRSLDRDSEMIETKVGGRFNRLKKNQRLRCLITQRREDEAS